MSNNPTPTDAQPKTDLEVGSIAYDLCQHTPVVIVDPDVGTIADQPDAQRDRIVKSKGNRAIGFSAETQCAEVTYLELTSSNDSTYTFPLTRLGVPDTKVGDNRLSMRQFIQYRLIRELHAEAKREDEDVAHALRAHLEDLVDYAVLDAALSSTDTDEDA